jgi:hypothetical protein
MDKGKAVSLLENYEFLEEYARRIEADIAEFKRDLAPLESGELRLSERKANGPWVDTTQREIDWHKRTIAQYEVILTQIRGRLAGQPG